MTGKEILKRFRSEGFGFRLEPKLLNPSKKEIKTDTVEFLKVHRDEILTELCNEHLDPLRSKE